MATSKQLMFYETVIIPEISLASMANAAGSVSNPIDNTTTKAPCAHVFLKVGMNTAPTANTPVKVYLIRHSNYGPESLIEGRVGAVSASLSAEPTQAQLIGSIIVAAVASSSYIGDFVAYDLPPKYSIAIWNATGQALSNNPVSSSVQVIPFGLEAQ